MCVCVCVFVGMCMHLYVIHCRIEVYLLSITCMRVRGMGQGSQDWPTDVLISNTIAAYRRDIALYHAVYDIGNGSDREGMSWCFSKDSKFFPILGRV